jgi:hypothetical protein
MRKEDRKQNPKKCVRESKKEISLLKKNSRQVVKILPTGEKT